MSLRLDVCVFEACAVLDMVGPFPVWVMVTGDKTTGALATKPAVILDGRGKPVHGLEKIMVGDGSGFG